MAVELGDRAKDKITGFEGIVIGKTRWLYGCDRITIQPEDTKDGKPIDAATFDEPQVEVVRRGVIKTAEALAEQPAGRRNGGPRPEPVRRGGPSRR